MLLFETTCLPVPKAGEALVRIEAAGVSGFDVMLRGHRFPGFPPMPCVPGEKFVGQVESVGQDVGDLEPSQRVGAWTFGKAGGYAGHVVKRPAAELVPVPEGPSTRISPRRFRSARPRAHRVLEEGKVPGNLVLVADP